MYEIWMLALSLKCWMSAFAFQYVDGPGVLFKPNSYTAIYYLKVPVKFDFSSFEHDIETAAILWHLNQ